MERLTERERNYDGTGISKEDLIDATGLTQYTDKVLTKLADLEDAEEDGRLIILPCKPGDTVYHLHKRYGGCTYFDSNKEKWIIEEITLDQSGILSAMVQKRFGESIFTTHEAAEQALQKMKGE